MKHSYYSTDHRLFIACVECKRGYYGAKICSSGWQHKIFKGQGCFSGELIRPECYFSTEPAQKCPFIDERNHECLNDDGVCESYSYETLALKKVNEEMMVLAIQKNDKERQYKELVKEQDELRKKSDKINGKIDLLVGQIVDLENQGMKMAGKWNELGKIVSKKSELKK
jgi:hypothetical protein